MRRLFDWAVTGFAIVGVLASIQQVTGQGIKLESRTVTYIGMVVRDAEKTAKLMADIWGVEPPQVRLVPAIAYPPNFSGDRTATAKLAMFRLENLGIEIFEPVGGQSAYKDFLDKRGEGLNRISFNVPDVAQGIKVLESKGGQWVLGDSSYAYAHVFMPNLGFSIELHKPPAPRPAQ